MKSVIFCGTIAKVELQNTIRKNMFVYVDVTRVIDYTFGNNNNKN